MRILINTINFAPELTSTGKYTGEMAQWLALRGHEIRVVTTPPHYPQREIAEGYSGWRFKTEKMALPNSSSNTLQVLRCPVWVPRVPRGWKRILYLSSFAVSSWPAMLKQVVWKPDLVLLIEPTVLCAPQVLCVARLVGATSWIHVQDFEVDMGFQFQDFSFSYLKPVIWAAERLLMRNFSAGSTITAKMLDRLVTKGVRPARAILFPNWVDTAQIYPLNEPSSLRLELGITANAIVALYSGNMGLKQGIHLLLEASKRLQGRADIVFVLCGDGPYRETLVQMAGKACNIRFLSLQPLERLNELLNLADIHLLPQMPAAADLVMPSKLAGMLASGKAIVATAAQGTQLSEVLTGCGICTEPGDANALAQAIEYLADRPELRQRYGERARKYAVSHLERDTILERFELSVLEICGNSAPGTSVALVGTHAKKMRVT